jgi:mannose-6-phosphate isomerase-like protein (cupin superfamily)
MKNRRSFLQTAAFGLMAPAMVSLPDLCFANNSNINGIIKNADEGETYFVREKTPLTIKVSKKANGINSVSICTEEIPGGGGIPTHKHLYNDEIFFFHKGSGSFSVNDQEFTINEGSIAFVPRGTWHGLKNTSNDLLIFTFSYSPAGFEDFFRQIGTLKGKPFKAKTHEEVESIAKKYGMLYK